VSDEQPVINPADETEQDREPTPEEAARDAALQAEGLPDPETVLPPDAVVPDPNAVVPDETPQSDAPTDVNEPGEPEDVVVDEVAEGYDLNAALAEYDDAVAAGEAPEVRRSTSPGTERSQVVEIVVAALRGEVTADDPEPTYVDPFRPTLVERARWEAWRDAKDRARRAAIEADVAAQGFPTPDPRPEIEAAAAAQGTATPGASRSADVDRLRSFEGATSAGEPPAAGE
jgi:hypothetical protein